MSERYLRIRTIIQGLQHILEGSIPSDLDWQHTLSLAGQDEVNHLTNRELLTTVVRHLQESQDQLYPVYLDPPTRPLCSSERREERALVPTRGINLEILANPPQGEFEEESTSELGPEDQRERDSTSTARFAQESTTELRLQALESSWSRISTILRQFERRINILEGGPQEEVEVSSSWEGYD